MQFPPIPPRVRLGIYLVSGVGSAVVAYLVAKGIAGDAEVTLWAALVAVVNGMSAAYVPTKRADRVRENDAGHTDVVTVLVAVALLLLVLWLLGALPGPR